jgi:hypothetical protein
MGMCYVEASMDLFSKVDYSTKELFLNVYMPYHLGDPKLQAVVSWVTMCHKLTEANKNNSDPPIFYNPLHKKC